MFPPYRTHVPKKMTLQEQIKKFRILCGQNMAVYHLKLQVYTLMNEIHTKQIPNSAQLGDLYTAGELRAVGAWWTDAHFILEITNFYLLNVILACADEVKLDKARHRDQVMQMMEMYASRAGITAEALFPIVNRVFGTGEYNEEAALICQAKREAYVAGMDPQVMELAKQLAERIQNVSEVQSLSEPA